jgi:hypothetical protein
MERSVLIVLVCLLMIVSKVMGFKGHNVFRVIMVKG